MAKTKSLYELKQEAFKRKNKNTVTDADYFLRDKEQEAKEGYPNTLDMTPPTTPAKKTSAVSKGA